MAIEKCKGTRDMSPSDMAKFRAIEDAFRDVCLKWGYEEVRTPTLEYLYLFTAAGTLTPGRLGRVYSFLDWDGWSGERVVMRPDGTIPIARYYIENTGDGSLARLFYVNNVFSFEETGAETREKWQCGAELIGAGSTAADVELVLMALDTLRKLGLKDVELKLTHAGLIRAILSGIKSNPEEQTRVFDRVLDGDTKALVEARPELANIVTPILTSKGKSSGFLKNVSVMVGNDVPELKDPIENFTELAATLDDLGTPYEIDIASGRGFEYYTGLIFQIWSCGDMVAGGGRYNALIPLLGGTDTPASGFALYVDRLMELVGNVRTDAVERVMVRPATGQSGIKEAFAVIEALHNTGLPAQMAPAEFDVSQSGAKWLIETSDTGWHFSLQDIDKGDLYEVATVDEVLARLKERGKARTDQVQG